ncbi:MAG: murein L,D-transpeptidase family protein [Bdellovibrionales bacterium]
MKFLFLAIGVYFSLHNLNAQDKVPEGLIRLGNGSYFSDFAVVVDKTSRTTSVWKNENNRIVKIRDYVSDQGSASGDKILEGDKKTPEGVYFFNKIIEGKNLYFPKYGKRAYTTNYPNFFDRKEGKTGYGIWLHGIPDETSLTRGSEGCVVIRNDAVMEVGDFIELGKTPIVINPGDSLVPRKKHSEIQSKYVKLLQAWRKAWSTKDIDSYISHYSESFTSKGMNKTQWKKYKDFLNKKYKTIFVEFSDPIILKQNGQTVVRTIQHYRSDIINDYGEKTIYLEEVDGAPKIVAEFWKRVDHATAKSEILAGTILRAENLLMPETNEISSNNP